MTRFNAHCSFIAIYLLSAKRGKDSEREEGPQNHSGMYCTSRNIFTPMLLQYYFYYLDCLILIHFLIITPGFRRDQGFHDHKGISNERAAEADEESQSKLHRLDKINAFENLFILSPI